jgi:hypothetical protein
MSRSKCVFALLGSSLIAQLVCAQTPQASGSLSISAVSSSATPETATVSWTTNLPATSRLDYGTSRDALTMNVVDSSFVTQHSLTMTGLTPGTKYIVEITSVTAGGEKATQFLGNAGPTPAQAPAPAPVAAPAEPAAPAALTTPSMAGPVQALPPALFNAGPFGKLAVNGVLSGYGMLQTNHLTGDKSSQMALSNGQIFLQKADGVVQFYIQAGTYTLPSLASPFMPNDTTMTNTYGPVPVGFLKLQAGKNTSFQIGALPTLIGAEYTFTFQNMNINRGLLWNQEPAVSRGIQVNQAMGKFSASVSWNDGYYSNRYTWISGLLAYTSGHHSLAFAAGGNYSGTAYQTFAAPVQNNSSIYNVIYTYNNGSLILQPYFQYSNVPTNPTVGVSNGAHTTSGAILANYTFKNGFSIPMRWEYIVASGNPDQGNVNLLFGPGSSATSLTFTPTFQKGGFFIRGDAAWVHAMDYVPGAIFGTDGMAPNQFRAALEVGVIFGNNIP